MEREGESTVGRTSLVVYADRDLVVVNPDSGLFPTRWLDVYSLDGCRLACLNFIWFLADGGAYATNKTMPSTCEGES